MLTRSDILVIAATERELAAPDGWQAVRCGVGPVDAAAAAAAAIAAHRPAAVLQVGIAGARRASGIAPGTVVIGTEARYCDLGVSAKWAPNVVAASPELLAAATRALPQARTGAIGTSARIGGTQDVDVEAMEGFAVLRAAQLAGVPAIEIRAISNAIEESDRARWQFDAAFSAIIDATPRLIAELARA
jgi:futalosine hydrolase